MPIYDWTCRVCGGTNGGGVDVCARCGSPSELSADDIQRLRREGGLDSSPAPRRGYLSRLLARPAVWLLGGYALAVALAAIHALTCGGDMCSLLLQALALPWVLVPFSLALDASGGWFLMVLGFAANAGILYAIGRSIARWRRSGKSEA